MRRSSLTPQQARLLAELLRNRREALGLSMRQVCAMSGYTIATLSVLEAGTNLSPQPDTLKAIAGALELPISDVFVVTDWLPPDELPTLKPYLRAKYRELDEGAIRDLERYAERLAQRHGGIGPIANEDETPE